MPSTENRKAYMRAYMKAYVAAHPEYLAKGLAAKNERYANDPAFRERAGEGLASVITN